MNFCRETAKMGVTPGNRPAGPRDSEAYLNGTSQVPTTRGRREGRPYPWSQQVIHEISG